MPLDQALIGSALTGILALRSQAVSKCKCHIACARDADGELFLDAPLFQDKSAPEKESAD